LVFAGDGKISFEICSTQFPTYFFSKYVQHISLTYFGFFFGVLNSAIRGLDRSLLLFVIWRQQQGENLGGKFPPSHSARQTPFLGKKNSKESEQS
jgi:hypothetical protein